MFEETNHNLIIQLLSFYQLRKWITQQYPIASALLPIYWLCWLVTIPLLPRAAISHRKKGL
jgi:hypothetical protein